MHFTTIVTAETIAAATTIARFILLCRKLHFTKLLKQLAPTATKVRMRKVCGDAHGMTCEHCGGPMFCISTKKGCHHHIQQARKNKALDIMCDGYQDECLFNWTDSDIQNISSRKGLCKKCNNIPQSSNLFYCRAFNDQKPALEKNTIKFL